MTHKSPVVLPLALLVWLLAMIGATFGVAALIWGLHGQGEKFWVNFIAVAAMEVLVACSWFFMGMRKKSRMVAFDFGFGVVAGLYVVVTLGIALIGLTDIPVAWLLVLHLLSGAGFITLALVFTVARSATTASWEGLDDRRRPMERMQAELRRITAKVPADASAATQVELAQLAEALKYATDESLPGGEAEDTVVAARLAEFNVAVDGLPGDGTAFHAAARRVKQAVEEREIVMKDLRSRR